VGGVAGGASCAARARRMSEAAEIIILERGPYVSFANCGLPYYVGNVIKEEEALLVATPELFRERFNIEVRLENEVLSIDRINRKIKAKYLKSGTVYHETYDALVLAPGSAPIRPPLPGIDMDGILALRTIPDSRQIRQWIDERKVRRVVVVGGGFIGLEMTENLANRGLSVTLMEASNQLMPPLDSEMASPLQDHLITKRVEISLGHRVTGFEQNPNGTIDVCTETATKHSADLVILAIGVQPEVGLARTAGIEIGNRGGIRVDDQMRTSDKRIWAVGDAIEVRDFVIGQWTTLPLAGPANRQGRIAADVILGREARFRGTQGTAICKAFDLTVAMTGASEKNLKRCGIQNRPVEGDAPMVHWDNIHTDRQTILDVRDPDEFNADHLEGALNIPLGQLRQRMKELDQKGEILAYCAVGQRSYYASRALRQHGFNARNISGGYKSLVAYENAGMGPE
jgi:NADPH-dependent 2,4-dienoyl-CoA reductase/sulfur reductase-like enzyme